MNITLWGVRGSIPNANRNNQYYGANTTCLELRPNSGELLIFDAGTGIRSLGKTLPDSGVCHLFISHGHADHTQGLCFFQPFFNPAWTIHLYLPDWLSDLPQRVFNGSSFPLSFNELAARVLVHSVSLGQTFGLKGSETATRVEAFAGCHPGGSLAYKVYTDEAVFLFSGDHEIAKDKGLAATRAMLQDVSVAVVDATFSRQDMISGKGHSAWEDWHELAAESGVQTLILSHHEADRTDAALDALQNLLSGQGDVMRVLVAKEGERVPASASEGREPVPSDWMRTFIDGLSNYKEENALLDSILHKAREITRADAGTFYLADGNELVFAYAHNDTLFSEGDARKSAYVSMRLPIDLTSIAGFVAATGKSLNLPDVYALSDAVHYRFNSAFDEKTGYRTRSMLTVPIRSRSRKLLGVLQLINSMGESGNDPRPFSSEMEQLVLFLAREAAAFLEISAHIRGGINQLLRIAVLHDPTETGPHAERVGAIAAELYQHWAEKRGESLEQIRFHRSQLRLAAMLHDIGKVGISDLVLKKNGQLTDEEYAVMKSHARLGAELFPPEGEGMDELAHEISLHHHQKWNGQGYPRPDSGTPLVGEAIPLAARITAIADVFDALVSPRSYKEPWSFEKAEEILHKDAGTHFDPELTVCFSEIMDTVKLIYKRFPE